MFNGLKKGLCAILAVTMVTTMSGAPITALAGDSDNPTMGDGWGYDKTTGHYYEFVDEYTSYTNALEAIAAKGNGAHMATVSTPEENEVINKIANTIKSSGSYWIGLYCNAGGQWAWQDSTPVDSDALSLNYSFHTDNVPSSDSAVLVSVSDSTSWLTKGVNRENYYIVEYDFCPHNQKECKNKTFNCDTGGYTGDVICNACAQTLSVGEEKGIDYDSHTYTTNDTKVANCFVDGKAGDAVCSKCGFVSAGEILHIDHDFNSDGICTKCGMIKNATLDKEYTAGFSQVLFNVLSFKPAKNGTYSYSAIPLTGRDARAYLYDDFDKMQQDINKFYQTEMDTYTTVQKSMTQYVTEYHSETTEIGQPVVKYSLKNTKTYYYVLMPFVPSAAQTTDSFTIKVECNHSSTHIDKGTATCDTAGTSDKVVCDICGKTVSGGEQIPAYHAEGSTYLKTMKACKATCFTAGYDENTVICTVCGQVLSGAVTPQLTHDYDANGVCKNCSLTKVADINTAKDVKLTETQPWQVFSYNSNAFGSMTVALSGLGSYSASVYAYSSYDRLSSQLASYIESGVLSYDGGGKDILSSSNLLATYPSFEGDINYKFNDGTTYYFLVIPKSDIVTDITGSFRIGCNHSEIRYVTASGDNAVACKDQGILEEWCEVCGHHIGSCMSPVYPHSVNPRTVTKNAYSATCKRDGYTGDKYCYYCSELIEEGTAIPNLHSKTYYQSDPIASWLVHMDGVPATCFTNSVSDYYFCTICGANAKQPTIGNNDYLHHDFVTDDKGNSVCSKCGMVNDTEIGEKHTKMLSQGDNIYVVSFTPKAVAGSSDSHNYTFDINTSMNYKAAMYQSEEDIRRDCNSKYDGTFTDSSLIHSSGNSISCQLKAGKTYYFLVTLISPTEKGKNVTVSINCDHDKTTTTKGAATCKTSGITDRVVCDVCGEVLSEGTEVEAYGHFSPYTKSEVRDTVSATCNTKGFTGNTYCLDCGEIIEEGTVIPTHHDDESYYVYLKDAVESSCVRKGRTSTIICKECGKVIKASQETDRQYSAHHYVDGYCELCGVPEDFLTNDSDGNYIVKSVGDFIILCNFLNNSNYQKNINVKLTSNIDLSTYIGSHGWNDVSFDGGTFDGDGHTISGVNIDGVGTAKALFNDVKNSTIKNLIVSGDVKVEYENAAIFASQSNNVIYDNVTVNGYVKGATSVGGITANAKDSTFTSCVNNATCTSSDVLCVVGGIAASAKDSTFTSCTNNGTITTPDSAGGIVGKADSITADSCINNGDVTSTDNAGNAGGIVGIDTQLSTIKNSGNTGAISSQNNSGGIIGATLATTIDNCFNDGNVSGLYAGGIAGFLNGGSSINKGYNTGTITAIEGDKSGGISGTTDGSTGQSTVTNSDEAHTHTYDSGVVTKQPDCTNEGVRTFTCTTCPKTRTEAVAPLGHSANYIQPVQPTCTAEGSNGYWHCSRCEKLFNDQQCTNEITLVDTVVAKLPHTYNSQTTAPTCTNQGYTTYVCSVCGDSYVDNYVSALGHTPNAPVKENVVEPTCTAKGSYDDVVYCSTCGVELSREHKDVDSLGHSYNTVITPPTCTAKGYTTRTCTRCGYKTVSDYTNATGHSFGNNSKTCLNCGIANPNYVAPAPSTTPSTGGSTSTGGTTSTGGNTTAPSTGTSTAPTVVGTVSKPKTTSISKLTKGKKQFKVTYKKIGGVTGYQIQYSTSKKFTKKTTKTVKVKGYKSTSKTIKKLKAKKKYYVRVRTYKTVSGTTSNSSWSKVKTVTTK